MDIQHCCQVKGQVESLVKSLVESLVEILVESLIEKSGMHSAIGADPVIDARRGVATGLSTVVNCSILGGVFFSVFF